MAPRLTLLALLQCSVLAGAPPAKPGGLCAGRSLAKDTELIIASDSVGRQAWVDFARSQLFSCDGPPLPSAEVCDSLTTLRAARSDFSVAADGVIVQFRHVTFMRTVTTAPWLNATLAKLRVQGGAPVTLLLGSALWNLKWDPPPSVPSSLYSEAGGLLNALEGVPKGRVLFRGITPIEPNTSAVPFPPHYTDALVSEADWVLSSIVKARGYGVVDVRPILAAAPAGSFVGGRRTTDGTHLPREASVAMMRGLLAEVCPRMLSDPATTGGAAPAPPVSAFRAAAYLIASGAVVLLCRLSLSPAYKARLGTVGGFVAVHVVAAACVYVMDVARLLPVVEKERRIGFDSLLAFSTVATVAAIVYQVVAAQREGAEPVSKALSSPHSAAEGASFSSAASLPEGKGGAGAERVGSPSASPRAEERHDEVSIPLRGEPPASPFKSAMFQPLAQTLEFKGWMMLGFLLYHYWDVKAVYAPVRVAVASYLFLTGYGNYLSLRTKGRPTLHKLSMAIVRINLLPSLVMAVTRSGWLLYYIAPLHTLWTLVVYAYFAAGMGDGPSPGVPPPLRTAAVRLGGLLLCIVLFFEVPGVAEFVLYLTYPLLGYCGSLHEVIFRSKLDAYAPWAGMALAAAVPSLTALLDQLDGRTEAPREGESDAPARAAVLSPLAATVAERLSALLPARSAGEGAVSESLVVTLGLGAACTAVFLGQAWTLFPLEKTAYNSLHRFTSPLPIVLYLLLRNLTPAARRTHSLMLANLGTMSLELYILQFHVWLARSAKALVVLFPEARALSFVVQSGIFLALAYACSVSTKSVLGYLEKHAHAATGAAAGILALIALVNVLPGSCPL
jgi:hypothetical protein